MRKGDPRCLVDSWKMKNVFGEGTCWKGMFIRPFCLLKLDHSFPFLNLGNW